MLLALYTYYVMHGQEIRFRSAVMRPLGAQFLSLVLIRCGFEYLTCITSAANSAA